MVAGYEVNHILEYNNKNFCSMIIGRLKEADRYDFSILDYALADELNTCVLKNAYFTFKTGYGGSEGIYTDIYLSYEVSDNEEPLRKHVLTFKTLHDTWEEFEKMAILGAAFVCRANAERNYSCC